MGRTTTWALTLVLACAPPSAAALERDQHAPNGKAQSPSEGKDKLQSPPNAPGGRERWKWWLYDRAELGITDKQSADINEIFESSMPKLRETRQELERAEDELSRAIKEHKADLATISMLVDRVESARSQHSKLRVLTLYRMHLLLSPEQRVKLEAVRARQDHDRRGKDSAPGHRRTP